MERRSWQPSACGSSWRRRLGPSHPEPVAAGREPRGASAGWPRVDGSRSSGEHRTLVNILGINCFAHDTAAALLQDGRPVAFIEQERFNREKHTKAFPDDAIQFCLASAGLSIEELDVVAFAHRAGADFERGALDALKRLPRGAKRLAAQAYVDTSLVRKQRAFIKRYGF